MESSNLLAIFLTGLFTGGLTCLAVQGGLLASAIAQREQEKLQESLAGKGRALPIASFLIAKLIAYTLLGFLLGWFGSLFELSLTTQVIMQFIVGIFMVGTALNLLNVHPLFRYFIIQPPKFLTRIVRKQSKSGDLFAPALLGTFTVFIPCGTTQAMMALAIATGNPVTSASILFAFTLGTLPIFFALGYFSTRLGGALHQNFMKAAAYAIILLAVYNLNGTAALAGSPITFDTFAKNIWCTVSFCDDSLVFANSVAGIAVQNATIQIEGAGYSPSKLVVKAGSTVTLTLVNSSSGGCTQAFTIPQLGIQKIVPMGKSDTVQFTAPSEPGELAFMCSMGMYRGTIKVVKS